MKDHPCPLSGSYYCQNVRLCYAWKQLGKAFVESAVGFKRWGGLLSG